MTLIEELEHLDRLLEHQLQIVEMYKTVKLMGAVAVYLVSAGLGVGLTAALLLRETPMFGVFLLMNCGLVVILMSILRVLRDCKIETLRAKVTLESIRLVIQARKASA